MPAVSKKQFRFLQALQHGGLKNPPEGLTKKKAQEFTQGVNYKALPESAPSAKPKYTKIKRMLKK